MARIIDSATLAQLQAGRVAIIDILLFDFPAPTGVKAFFSGHGEFTYNSVTYQGAGSIIAISPAAASADGTAQGLKLTVNAAARDGLDTSILSTIETVNYAGRPVIYSVGYLHPDTYALLSVETAWRGFVDYGEHSITEGGDAAFTFHCESRSLDLGRSGYRMRTDADQRMIDPNDGSLKAVSTTGQKQLAFGRVTPETFGFGRKKKKGLF
jgi:hypothetical protein